MTLAILSWGAHQTLVHTLTSYQKYGLDLWDEDRVIFFQEYSKKDKEIAKEFGYESFGSPENIGIAEAYKLLVNYASGDIFLFLENDWELIEVPHALIGQGKYLLEKEFIDVARFRHRKNPGSPLWSRQYAGNETAPGAEQYLLDAVFWMDEPQKSLPQIDKINNWFIAPAANANWTNNPTMFRTEWLREIILPRITGDIEVALQGWWREQEYILVGQSDGLFTHNRLDR